MATELLAVGCSWGGLRATTVLLQHLPADLPIAIVVVQHRSAARSRLVELLASATALPVSEAEDKAPVTPRHVYVAPGGYHLMIDGDSFSLATDGPVRHSRPSIDVFMSAAAEALGERVAGMILTGANDDGADGLARVAALGGATFVQDPATAERRAMPDAAIAAVPSAVVASLPELALLVTQLVTGDPRS